MLISGLKGLKTVVDAKEENFQLFLIHTTFTGVQLFQPAFHRCHDIV